MYQLAVFDMAGTTIDDRDEVYRVLREATQRFGARYSDETFQEWMGTEKRHAIVNLLRVGGVEPTAETVGEAWEYFREELKRTYEANPPTPLPGVDQALRTLQDSGMKIGLTTGFSREIVDVILPAMGWGIAGERPAHPNKDAVVVDVSVTGDEVDCGRPAPDLIQAVMRRAGAHDPGAVINVGDTAADIRSALSAGVTATGVLTGHLSKESFSALGADVILASVADLPEYLGISSASSPNTSPGASV